jgi:hypothetical protein
MAKTVILDWSWCWIGQSLSIHECLVLNGWNCNTWLAVVLNKPELVYSRMLAVLAALKLWKGRTLFVTKLEFSTYFIARKESWWRKLFLRNAGNAEVTTPKYSQKEMNLQVWRWRVLRLWPSLLWHRIASRSSELSPSSGFSLNLQRFHTSLA